jgi:hypothetical protein
MGYVWLVVKRKGKREIEAILKNRNREVDDEIDQSKAE